MKNDFEVRDKVTAIFINSPKYGSMETLISTNKLERAKELSGTWHVLFDKKTGLFYVQGKLPNSEGKSLFVLLHRWITKCPKGIIVDHINNKTLDNTDSNLRSTNKSGNAQNLKGAHKDSKSGIRGVSWCNTRKKWIAKLTVNSKQMPLGRFDTIEEADQAVKEARAKLMPYSKEALSS